MKESQDKNWKDEVLSNFEKPRHSGFTDEVMRNINALDEKVSVQPAPLISSKQWFYTGLFFSIIILLTVFVEYKMDFEFGYIEDFSTQLLQWVNDNLSSLWIVLTLLTVFFVFSLINQKKFTFKI
jgi:hypothetical protein